MKQAKTLIFATALCSLFFSGCSDKQDQAQQKPMAMPVHMIVAKAISLPYSLEEMAQTEGAKETEVRARVGGILMKRLYDEGSAVKKNQPLFQIDEAPYKIAYSQARVKLEQAVREEKRLKGLVAKQAVSQKEYDDSYSARLVAQEELNQAKLNLEWTTVRAPVEGVTGRATKSEGSLVTTGADSLLTSIYQNDPIWVRFGLSDSVLDATSGKKGNLTGIELILPNGKVYSEKGKINFLASTVDTVLGTRQLRAEFANPKGELLPGQFVRIRLIGPIRNNVFLVPQTAVVQTEKGYLLMIADKNNKVEARPVEVAEWHGTDWVITGGLKQGDRIIIDNLMKLRTGAEVMDAAVLEKKQQAQQPQQQKVEQNKESKENKESKDNKENKK